jgi:heme/copper-type cytochrome/quinol oxidase subunit 2
MNRRQRRIATALALLASVGVLAWAGWRGAAAQQPDTRREFEITASNHAFSPSVIEVQQDDLVRITVRAQDIAHSFTLDEYRIAKRAAAGQSVTFEFRADRPGTFPFYCDLKLDEGCRNMRGQLVVRPR